MIQIVAKVFSDKSDKIDKQNPLYEIKPRYIKKVNIPTATRPDNNSPQWGIISNSGNMSIADTPNELLNILQNSETRKYIIIFYMRNTLTKAEEEIEEFYIDDFSYNKLSRELTIQYSDNLTDWQNINIPSKAMTETDVSARSIFNFLANQTGETKFPQPSYSNGYGAPLEYLRKYDSTTYNAIANCHIKYPIIRKGTLWQMWQRLCELCALNIFRHKGKIIVRRGL